MKNLRIILITCFVLTQITFSYSQEISKKVLSNFLDSFYNKSIDVSLNYLDSISYIEINSFYFKSHNDTIKCNQKNSFDILKQVYSKSQQADYNKKEKEFLVKINEDTLMITVVIENKKSKIKLRHKEFVSLLNNEKKLSEFFLDELYKSKAHKFHRGVWFDNVLPSSSAKYNRYYADYNAFIKDDFLTASEYYYKAYSYGDKESLLILHTNEELISMIDSNYHSNFMLFLKKEVEKEVPIALYLLGLIYENDYQNGKNINPNDFLKLYQKAASLGEISAISKIAWFYFKGFWYKKNNIKALSLYSKLAGKENPVFYESIGDIYYEEKKYVKAKEFYLKAINNGYEYTCLKLERLYRYGLGVEKDEKKADEYLEEYEKIRIK